MCECAMARWTILNIVNSCVNMIIDTLLLCNYVRMRNGRVNYPQYCQLLSKHDNWYFAPLQWSANAQWQGEQSSISSSLELTWLLIICFFAFMCECAMARWTILNIVNSCVNMIIDTMLLCKMCECAMARWTILNFVNSRINMIIVNSRVQITSTYHQQQLHGEHYHQHYISRVPLN